MLQTLLHWASLHLMTPWGLAAAVGAAVVAGFYIMPTQTLALITNWRTWAIVGALAAYLGYHQLQAQNADLKTQNTQLSSQVATMSGAMASIEVKLDSQKRAAVQVSHLKSVAAQAPEGQKEDAVLDQISADDAANTAPAAPGGAGGSQLDGVLDGIASGTGPGKPHP